LGRGATGERVNLNPAFQMVQAFLKSRLTQCSRVAEAAVIGVKDERWGERPMALVVKDPKSANGAIVANTRAAAT